MTNLREIRAIWNYHSGRADTIFIHIPKNAGVSLRKAPELINRVVSANPYFHKSRSYTQSLAQTMRENHEHHGYQHARWRDLHVKVQERLRAVAIVRNPWARVVSRFRFAQLAMAQGTSTESYSARDFEAFLDERFIYGEKPYYWHRAIRGWYPQSDYVTDEAGQIQTDILRFECLDSDVMEYFNLEEPLRKRNQTSSKNPDYRDYYTRHTLQLIADWYASDINLFGFDFDSCATRNTRFV